MPLLPSVSPGRPAFPYNIVVRVSLWTSVVIVAALFGWGSWQRRWIADDGLIVLRTVRNLLAGNGPVFNEGERVEANTSTAWTYLMYAGSWVGGPMRMEYVALALALTLSVLGVAFLMLGTGRLFAPSLRGRRAIMLPAGALVYIALPPARDFATSGLESGLVLAYLGLLWWMMVCWSQPLRMRPDSGVFLGALAFVAGGSVLVRPELALMGGAALIMMLIAARDWRRRVLIVVAGGLVPVAYQIFRMGYYGLLVPGTALAKDAAGDKWPQGMIYLSNFNEPYALWAPIVLLVPLGLLVMAARRRPSFSRPMLAPNYGRVARAVQSPPAVVAFVIVSGLLQAFYWIRQGATSCMGGSCWRRSFACWLRCPSFRWQCPTGPMDPASRGRPAIGWVLPPLCSGLGWPAGRCGPRTPREWVMTPPASPTRESSTSAVSTLRPPGTPIR